MEQNLATIRIRTAITPSSSHSNIYQLIYPKTCADSENFSRGSEGHLRLPVGAEA